MPQRESKWHSPLFKRPVCCEKYLKHNKHNSLHLALIITRIIFHEHCTFCSSKLSVFLELSENCSPLATVDNVTKQIAEHIFAPNTSHCLLIHKYNIRKMSLQHYIGKHLHLSAWGHLYLGTYMYLPSPGVILFVPGIKLILISSALPLIFFWLS